MTPALVVDKDVGVKVRTAEGTVTMVLAMALATGGCLGDSAGLASTVAGGDVVDDVSVDVVKVVTCFAAGVSSVVWVGVFPGQPVRLEVDGTAGAAVEDAPLVASAVTVVSEPTANASKDVVLAVIALPGASAVVTGALVDIRLIAVEAELSPVVEDDKPEEVVSEPVEPLPIKGGPGTT